MALFDLASINKAIGYLGENYEAATEDIVSDPLKQIAELTTTETLDASDFFVLLSNPDLIQEDSRQESIEALRQFLDYSTADPEGVSLSFSTVSISSNVTVAATKITPDNVDETKAPIVFAGGIFHNTPVYLEFLRQTAIKTEREILAFDSPGVGGSHFNAESFTHEMLADSLPAVIESEYSDGRPVIVAGHSLGSVSVYNLFHHQEKKGDLLVENPVEKYVFIAPLRGYHFSLKYMLDGLGGLGKNEGKLVPGERSQEFYGQLHAGEDWAWVEDLVDNEKMPAVIAQYLKLLRIVARQSLKPRHMQDEKVAFLMMGEDNVFPCRAPKLWQRKGATIFDGADHSAIAGPRIDAAFVDQFIGEIEEGVVDGEE